MLAACVLAVLLAAHLAGQGTSASLQVLSRDGRRAIPLTTGPQEMIALDDLASVFQLNVRDDGGAITVGYRNRTIVLTPDQTIASVAGRLISLPTAPVRAGNRWLVPLEFVSRALAPIYDARLDLRRASRLLVVGDLRVPRVVVRLEPLAASARITLDSAPATPATVTQQGQRLSVRYEADALDLALPSVPPSGFVEALRGTDVEVGIDLGPQFSSYRATTQPIDGGSRTTIEILGAQTENAPPLAPPAPSELPPLNPAPAGIRAVAIDPGHGGDDTGVRGAKGTLEKDVTMAVARQLRAALESRLGVRVVMTREGDVAMPVEQRSALANNNKADLFVSLHANASFRPDVSGATVYVASFNQDDLANESLSPERLPVFGGGLRLIEVVPWNLAQIAHRDESEQFAQLVAGALSGRVALAAQPVEHAPLRVLESANMPAVLVEMGYLTNADQESALSSGSLQGAVAQAIFDAVVQFRSVVTARQEAGGR